MFTEMKKPKRGYVLKTRARQMARTRDRIVDAMMHLHEELGPSRTTVSAIAKRAGVERLTVYRHFDDEAEMFAACSGRYLQLNPPPQQGLWAGETGHVRRTSRGLEEIYSFFSRTAPMLEKVYRDLEECEGLEAVMQQIDAHFRGLADDLASAWPGAKVNSRYSVILRHACRFATWQSLGLEGLNDREKAALILEWLQAGASGPPSSELEEGKIVGVTSPEISGQSSSPSLR